MADEELMLLVRRAAVEVGVACLTSLDTTRALLIALAARTDGAPDVRSLQDYVRPMLAL